MADKISTLILKVDLDCDLCYKKIRRTLCKLQAKEDIQSIFYDEKSNTITISGPFNPEKLSKKLCSRACSVIKEMQIKDNKPKETKPANEKPQEKAAEPAAEVKKDKTKDVKPAEAKTDKSGDKPKDAKPAEAKNGKSDDKPKDAKPAEAKKDKSDDKPKDDKPKDDKPKDDKPKEAKPVEVTKNAYIGQVVEFGQTGYQPAWSAGGPACYCSPWGYYGDYKGCTCGTSDRGYGGPAYGWAQEVPPVVVYGGPSYGYQQSYQTMGPPAVVYGGPAYEVGYQTNKFFCEEEDPQSSCTIM